MRKLSSLILIGCLLTACSNHDSERVESTENNKAEHTENINDNSQGTSGNNSGTVANNSKDDLNNGNKESETNSSKKDEKDANNGSVDNKNQQKENVQVEKFKEALGTETNKNYEKTIEKQEVIIDAEYSVITALGIAKLIITVNDNVDLDEAKKIAEEQSEILLEKHPDYLPAVTIYKNNEKFYSTID